MLCSVGQEWKRVEVDSVESHAATKVEEIDKTQFGDGLVRDGGKEAEAGDPRSGFLTPNSHVLLDRKVSELHNFQRTVARSQVSPFDLLLFPQPSSVMRA